MRMPLQSVPPDRFLDVGFEIDRPCAVVPGCTVEAGAELSWKGRSISGAAALTGGMRHGTLSLGALRRGVYETSGGEFRVCDAAGFFRIIIPAGEPDGLTVRAGLRTAEELPDRMSVGGEDLSRLVKKKRSDEMIESRQYFPGDDVRRINWNAYAHTGELFIRMGEELPEPDSHLLVVIDLSSPGTGTGMVPGFADDYLDLTVACAGGIIKRLADAGVSVDCAALPGAPVAVSDTDFLSPLWWTSEGSSSDGGYSDVGYDASALFGGSGRGRGSCLLICTAFSVNAAAICRDAASGGYSVDVLIPVSVSKREGPVVGAAGRVAGRLLFRHQHNEAWIIAANDAVSLAAEKLTAGLGNIRGVKSAQIL